MKRLWFLTLCLSTPLIAVEDCITLYDECVVEYRQELKNGNLEEIGHLRNACKNILLDCAPPEKYRQFRNLDHYCEKNDCAEEPFLEREQ